MKPIYFVIAAALIGIAYAADNEQPIHADVQDQQVEAYYPGVSTYTPDTIIGSMEVGSLDAPYMPKAQPQIRYANYQEYAGNYASGQRPGYWQLSGQLVLDRDYVWTTTAPPGPQNQSACYGNEGGSTYYGWNGNGFPIMRAGLRVGARVASFPFRVIGRLFGRC